MVFRQETVVRYLSLAFTKAVTFAARHGGHRFDCPRGTRIVLHSAAVGEQGVKGGGRPLSVGALQVLML